MHHVALIEQPDGIPYKDRIYNMSCIIHIFLQQFVITCFKRIGNNLFPGLVQCYKAPDILNTNCRLQITRYIIRVDSFFFNTRKTDRRFRNLITKICIFPTYEYCIMDTFARRHDEDIPDRLYLLYARYLRESCILYNPLPVHFIAIEKDNVIGIRNQMLVRAVFVHKYRRFSLCKLTFKYWPPNGFYRSVFRTCIYQFRAHPVF